MIGAWEPLDYDKITPLRLRAGFCCDECDTPFATICEVYNGAAWEMLCADCAQKLEPWQTAEGEDNAAT